MHSYIEGIFLETGKFKKLETYTPGKNAIFTGNISLGQLSTLSEIPHFTYPEILTIVKRIDVLWFSNEQFKFPLYAFEVVDTLNTLTEALNRCLQLWNFQTNFMIIGPRNYQSRFIEKINKLTYSKFKSRFKYRDYDEVKRFYKSSIEHNEIENEFFSK